MPGLLSKFLGLPHSAAAHRMNKIGGALNRSMQHHLRHCHGGDGGNGPTKTDRVEPAAAQATVGPVEGWGVDKRHRTSAGQGPVWYPPVAGLTCWYRPTGAAALGAVIVDLGARSDFPWSFKRAVDAKDSGGFGPRRLNDQPGS